MKHSIYNQRFERKGSIYFDSHYSLLGLRFPHSSKLNDDFVEVVKEFLINNNLRIVSNRYTDKRHSGNNEPCAKIFDVFKIQKKASSGKEEFVIVGKGKGDVL